MSVFGALLELRRFCVDLRSSFVSLRVFYRFEEPALRGLVSAREGLFSSDRTVLGPRESSVGSLVGIFLYVALRAFCVGPRARYWSRGP